MSNATFHICHLISGDLWAGAEVQAFHLIRALHRQGQFKVSAIVLNHGELARRLTAEGILCHVLPENELSFRQLLLRIRRILIEQKTTVLHSHRYKENIIAALLKSYCGVSALVQTVHGVQESHRGWPQLKARLFLGLNDYFSRRSFEKIICVSQEIQQQLSRHFTEEQLSTLHNSIDISEIVQSCTLGTLRPELGLANDAAVIGTVGRMVGVKAYDCFLLAAELLLQNNPDCHFVLVGDGPERHFYENFADKLGIQNRVHFLGERRDVANIIGDFDIFAMSSDHEGIPMVLLEAMALGKAIVSTKVGGIPEVVDDGIDGHLVPVRDHNQLAACFIRLLNDQKEQQQLGQHAVQKIQNKFSLPSYIERISMLYRDATVRK